MKLVYMTLLVPLLAGCYCNTSLVLRNGTRGTIRAHGVLHAGPSGNITGKDVEVAPGKAKSVPGASYGDLFVTTATGRELVFRDVDIFDLGGAYTRTGNYMLIGPGYVAGYVMLGSNSCLYAVRPGKTAVDQTNPQPGGYPKSPEEGKERP